MSDKIFRDPLYNYVSIERPRHGWLIDLLSCPEVQRMRRIHQLGVSYLTYPGADHNRLAHSLGVVHLMQQALRHLETTYNDERDRRSAATLLAAALIHDVGHGPFSHLFEPCLGIDHEVWSKKIILCEDKGLKVNKVLRAFSSHLPAEVADLIDKDKEIDKHHLWMKYLLSSQLDVDRLDYLRRDSLFTGAGYGHYDYYRIVTTFVIHKESDESRSIVWPEKSKFAIEEYLFARHYMYQNVYLHKTTRGFEKMLEAMWRRARALFDAGGDVDLVPAISDFWRTEENERTVQQYLRIEEFSVLQQIQSWTSHPDKSLSDLAIRFLHREQFAMIEPPVQSDGLAPNYAEWEAALKNLIGTRVEYDPTDMYCLRDELKAKYNQPYFPEKEADEQSGKNAIRVLIDDKPIEISRVLGRLKPLREEPVGRVRHYIPKDMHAGALRLRDSLTNRR